MSLEIHYNVYGCFRPPEEDVALAEEAVEAGFEGVWLGDHFQPWIDSRPYTHHVLPFLGALVEAVPEVPVGTSVTCPMFRYDPPTLAQALATLDSMAPGRINLGVGTGEALNELPFIEGEWPDWDERAAMLREVIDCLRTLWTETEYTSFAGEHYAYDDIRLFTCPRGDIDIHWAAWGPTSCRMAAHHADHLLTVGEPSFIGEKVRPAFEDGLSDAGRSPEGVDLSTEVTANYGDPEALVAEIRDRGELVPADKLDVGDPRELQEIADDRLADMSDAEVREANLITDDPAEIIDRLEAYEAAGATRVLVGSNCGDPRATIEVFEEEVIPAFA